MAGYEWEYTKCQLNRVTRARGRINAVHTGWGAASQIGFSAAPMANVLPLIEDSGTGALPTPVAPSPLSGFGDRVLQLAQRLRFPYRERLLLRRQGASLHPLHQFEKLLSSTVSRPDFTHPDHRIFLGFEELAPLSLFRKIKQPALGNPPKKETRPPNHRLHRLRGQPASSAQHRLVRRA